MAIEENLTLYTRMYDELFEFDTCSHIHEKVNELIHIIHTNIEQFICEGYISKFTISSNQDTLYSIEEVFVFLTYILSYKEYVMSEETRVLIQSTLYELLQNIHEYKFTDIFETYDVPSYFKDNYASYIDYSYVVFKGPTHRLYDSLIPETISAFNEEYRVFGIYNDTQVEFSEEEPVNNDYELQSYKLKLYQLYYKFKNAMMFYSRWSYDSPRYDAKHARIRYFKLVWSMYLGMDDGIKECFYENVVKKFERINWTTMSRLFNPYDVVFKETYHHLIDYDFASTYHPILKQQITTNTSTE